MHFRKSKYSIALRMKYNAKHLVNKFNTGKHKHCKEIINFKFCLISTAHLVFLNQICHSKITFTKVNHSRGVILSESKRAPGGHSQEQGAQMDEYGVCYFSFTVKLFCLVWCSKFVKVKQEHKFVMFYFICVNLFFLIYIFGAF